MLGTGITEKLEANPLRKGLIQLPSVLQDSAPRS